MAHSRWRLHRTWLRWVAAGAGVALALALASPVTGSSGPGGAAADDAAWLLDQINAARDKAGLAPLQPDPGVAAVAAAHARDMIRQQYFSHTAPDGATLATRLHRAGVRFSAAGENLAGNVSPALAHRMLMSSPDHRAILLSPGFRAAGIAVVRGGPYGLMVVEILVAPPSPGLEATMARKTPK